MPALTFILYSFIALLIGGRERIGRDYYSYINDYNSIVFYKRNILEPGSYYLNKLSSELGFGYRGVFLFYAILAFSCIAISVCKANCNPILSALGLAGSSLLIFSLSGSRQFVAIAIFLFSISYIVEGKPLRYIFLSLIGSLFHSSSLFLFPFYLIRFIRRRFYLYAFVIIFSILLLLSDQATYYITDLLGPFLGDDYRIYITFFLDNSSDGGSRFGLGVLGFALIPLLIVLFPPSLKNTSLTSKVEYNVYTNLVFIGYSGLLFGTQLGDATRFFYYPLAAVIVWLPKSISYYLCANKHDARILFLLAYFLVYLIASFLVNPAVLTPNDVPGLRL